MDIPKTIGELREHLVEKATVDETFRAQLIADPKAAIKGELDLTIPDGYTVMVHEDVEDTSHVVLPPPAALAETELEAAAGGQVYRWSASRGRYYGTDEAITFWDDFNGPTYHGGPRHNAD